MRLMMRTRFSTGLTAIFLATFASSVVFAADKPAAKKSKPAQDQPASDDSQTAKDKSAKDTKKDPAAPAKINSAITVAALSPHVAGALSNPTSAAGSIEPAPLL